MMGFAIGLAIVMVLFVVVAVIMPWHENRKHEKALKKLNERKLSVSERLENIQNLNKTIDVRTGMVVPDYPIQMIPTPAGVGVDPFLQYLIINQAVQNAEHQMENSNYLPAEAPPESHHDHSHHDHGSSNFDSGSSQSDSGSTSYDSGSSSFDSGSSGGDCGGSSGGSDSSSF